MRLLLALTCAVVLLFSTSVAARADIVYVVSDTQQFGTLDLSTGAFSSIGTLPTTNVSMTDLNGGMIYAIDNNADTSTFLRTINPFTAATSTVGSVTPASIGTISQRPADGALFTISHITGDLYTIDPNTALTTLVGSTSLTTHWYTTAFDSSGNLYLADASGQGANSTLYQVNTTTGAATLIGAIGTGSNTYNVDAMVWDNGALYGFTDGTDKIIAINTTTGTGADTGVNWSGSGLTNIYGTAGMGAVPEPSSLVLCSVATAFAGVVGWRRCKRGKKMGCSCPWIG